MVLFAAAASARNSRCSFDISREVGACPRRLRASGVCARAALRRVASSTPGEAFRLRRAARARASGVCARAAFRRVAGDTPGDDWAGGRAVRTTVRRVPLPVRRVARAAFRAAATPGVVPPFGGGGAAGRLSRARRALSAAIAAFSLSANDVTYFHLVPSAVM